MAVPPNTTMATAISVGTSLPVTIVANAYNTGISATSDLWYYYDPQDGDTVIGVTGQGPSVSTGYRPTNSPWTNLASPDNTLGIAALQMPFQVPVTVGTRLYIKCHDTFTTNANPSTLTLRIKRGPTDDITTGLLAINDSTGGFPAVILDPDTAAPKAFVNGFSAGEGTGVLRVSGIVGALDIDLHGFRIYNADFSVRATPTGVTGYTTTMGTNQIDTFWLGKIGTGMANSFLVSVDRNGVVGTPIDMGAAGLGGLTPNAAGSKVYFSRSTAVNQALFVIDTSTFVVTTFLAGVANYAFACPPMMLTDDTILVAYERSGFATVIKRYNAAAVLQNTYTLAVDLQIERIFAAATDPAYFRIWTQTSTTNTFSKIKVSDGTVTNSTARYKFSSGESEEPATLTPTDFFGNDFSCVPWEIRGAQPTTTYPIRRQRRFLAPSSPDNKRIQIPVLELLQRTGIGNSDAPDPQVMMRFSKDGGKTWGPERWRSMGAIGRYADRVRWLRATGNYRNGVIEITVSDPVDVQWLAMLGEPTEGTS